jgi:hypothetical protein
MIIVGVVEAACIVGPCACWTVCAVSSGDVAAAVSKLSDKAPAAEGDGERLREERHGGSA